MAASRRVRLILKALEPAGDLEFGIFRESLQDGLIGDVDDRVSSPGNLPPGYVVFSENGRLEQEFPSLRLHGERHSGRKSQRFESGAPDPIA